jgi:phytanoyl-CoA hydroxylase
MIAHTLTVEQKRFYDQNGYILLKGVFTKQEAAEMRRDAHDLAARLVKVREIGVAWNTVKHTDPGKVVLHCHDVQFYSAAMSRLIVDARLTGPATSIIGPNVQLHHTKMFIKPPE